MPKHSLHSTSPDQRSRKFDYRSCSPKRRKRSGPNDRDSRGHRKSPGKYPDVNYHGTRREGNNEYRRSNKQSGRPEDGRWGRDDSSSSERDEENRENRTRHRKQRKETLPIDVKVEDRRRSEPSANKDRRDNQRHTDGTRVREHNDSEMKVELEVEGEKQGPNMELSGKLMEDTNVFNGVTVKYSEPPEAKKPKKRWRFYVFKGEEPLPTLHLHRQSAYLMGKDRKVVDIPIDHPSCSRQHAVLQYRYVPVIGPDGQKLNRVLPYVIDLESSNGTFLNNNKIEPKRYFELREKDVLKFGFSSREYVLLHDTSQDDGGV